MADRALTRHQARFLQQLQGTGVITDTSLAAYLEELGAPCDRSAIGHYRSGKRTAPLGLLWAILSHVSDEERIDVLRLIAEPFGLDVVPQHGASAGKSAFGEAMDALDAAHRATRALHEAHEDGGLDEDEIRRVQTFADDLRRQAAEFEAAVAKLRPSLRVAGGGR